MAGRRIRVLVQLGDRVAERVASAVPDVDVAVVAWDGDPPVAGGEVLLTLPWGAPNLERVLGGGVRWVHVLGTGVDRFPLHLLGDRVLTCSRGASAVPIAEWTLAVMLAFEKRLPGTWIHGPPAGGWHGGRLGTLAGKTLGLVGMGGIGTAVATRALAFDMRVRAFRRTSAPSPLAGVELAPTLEAVLEQADHVVLAVPATPATHHLLGERALRAVKPGVHLVNVARGALVDEAALRAALDDGRIALASLDAVEPEPLPAGHWMYAHPRVRLSPHVSWSAPGAIDELVDPFIEELGRYRRGLPLVRLVDRAAGY